MQVPSLGWKDPLEEGMATHSSILAWRIPWTEEPGGLQFMKSQIVGHDWSDLASMPVPTRNISLGQTKSHLKVSNQLLKPGTSALCAARAPCFPPSQWWCSCLTECWGRRLEGQKGPWDWNRYDRFPREPPRKQGTQSESYPEDRASGSGFLIVHIS